MIKRLLLIKLIFFSFFSFFSFSQEGRYFYEVDCVQGFTSFGTLSVKFMKEGLIIRRLKEKNWKEKIKFIPIDKLNYKKYEKLHDYIFHNNLINKELEEYQSNFSFGHVGDGITIYNVHSKEFIYLYYEVYDEEIDTLYDLINDLIPKRFKKKFSLFHTNLNRKNHPTQ